MENSPFQEPENEKTDASFLERRSDPGSNSERIEVKKPSEETTQYLIKWSHQQRSKQRSKTRTKVVLLPITFYGVSLLVYFALVVASAFNPNIDKQLVNDFPSQILNPLVTLSTIALGFDPKDKEQ